MRIDIYSEVKHIGLFQKRYFLLRLSDLFNTLVILFLKKKILLIFWMASIKQTSMQTHNYTGGEEENREISSKSGTNFFCCFFSFFKKKEKNTIKLFVSLLAAKATPRRRDPRGKLFEVTQRTNHHSKDIFAVASSTERLEPAAAPTFLITVRGS